MTDREAIIQDKFSVAYLEAMDEAHDVISPIIILPHHLYLRWHPLNLMEIHTLTEIPIPKMRVMSKLMRLTLMRIVEPDFLRRRLIPSSSYGADILVFMSSRMLGMLT